MHIASYEFADLAEVNRVMASDGFKQTIGEFDRHWLGRPLLVKGEPGTGKTMLAVEVARAL